MYIVQFNSGGCSLWLELYADKEAATAFAIGAATEKWGTDWLEIIGEHVFKAAYETDYFIVTEQVVN